MAFVSERNNPTLTRREIFVPILFIAALITRIFHILKYKFAIS